MHFPKKGKKIAVGNWPLILFRLNVSKIVASVRGSCVGDFVDFKTWRLGLSYTPLVLVFHAV